MVSKIKVQQCRFQFSSVVVSFKSKTKKNSSVVFQSNKKKFVTKISDSKKKGIKNISSTVLYCTSTVVHNIVLRGTVLRHYQTIKLDKSQYVCTAMYRTQIHLEDRISLPVPKRTIRTYVQQNNQLLLLASQTEFKWYGNVQYFVTNTYGTR